MKKLKLVHWILLFILLCNMVLLFLLEKKKSIFLENVAQQTYELYNNSFSYYLDQDNYTITQNDLNRINDKIASRCGIIQTYDNDFNDTQLSKFIYNSLYALQNESSSNPRAEQYSKEDIYKYKSLLDHQYETYLKENSYYHAFRKINEWLKNKEEIDNAIF